MDMQSVACKVKGGGGGGGALQVWNTKLQWQTIWWLFRPDEQSNLPKSSAIASCDEWSENQFIEA